MSGIRMIVSDLDGTLLSEDNRLTDTVKRCHQSISISQGAVYNRYRPFRSKHRKYNQTAEY
ncbi:hypothetical protein [Paenibacillus periandrae]|uniref:hypothetical protein n=1 Tax=Paenibacillus periandrae TaxID=1761741 RepID=UPI001F09B43F|nr:hypothetical protein [Paenibacillus periandrae]